MVLQGYNWVHFAMWGAHFFYLVSFLPQILLNYRLKSLRGLSDLYLFAFFNGYVAEVFYVYCLGLPFAYRVMIPVCMLAMGVVIYQRFHYGTNTEFKRLFLIYGANLLCMFLLFPVAIKYSYYIGNFFGWMATLIWCTYQFPQVVKIFSTKSVHGFSFGLATMIGLAAALELSIGVTLGLPYQTIINSTRGVLIYLVFCLQFWLYRG